MANFKHPETIGLHGGEYRSDPATTAVAVPIYQTSSYQFKNAETAANLFGLKEFGNIYTRIMNPTCDVLEKRVAALESGLAAVAVGSGQAASAFCVQNVAQSGDNIVASTDLYGGTVNLFKNTLRQQGIEVRFADPADPKNFEKLTDDKTRAYYGESCPNPYLRVFPIKEVADIGKKKGIPLIIDNTASPVICKPLTHGAAVVCHSLTKYIGGQRNFDRLRRGPRRHPGIGRAAHRGPHRAQQARNQSEEQAGKGVSRPARARGGRPQGHGRRGGGAAAARGLLPRKARRTGTRKDGGHGRGAAAAQGGRGENRGRGRC